MLTNRLNDIFNNIHDGLIINIDKKNDNYFLTIEIEYLAKMLNSNYKYIKLLLINCDILFFYEWEFPEKKCYYEDFNKYLDLEIISSEIQDELVHVKCLTNEGSGGDLVINANTVNIYDENDNVLSIEELRSISKVYWCSI